MQTWIHKVAFYSTHPETGSENMCMGRGLILISNISVQLTIINLNNLRKIFQNQNSRSSRPEVFCEKAVLKKSAKFRGKHLCWSLSFNKVAGLRPATLLKERLQQRCFPGNFAKFLRATFLVEHLRWLLLKQSSKK